MTTPRYQLVDNTSPLFYHLVSRCVRGSRLCGRDRLTKRDYSHRKRWLLHRLRRLAKAFSLEVHAYAIMSNHFHLVVYYDPEIAETWTDDEVVDRWLLACPPKTCPDITDSENSERLRRLWLSEPHRIERMRVHLSSLSMFMKQLKQPIARRANQEDGCQGHFFEQRFYSGALLTEEAVLAAMAYVDLNPIRAKLAQSIEQIQYASIEERLAGLENSTQRLDKLLGPLISGLNTPKSKSMNIPLGDYLRRLEVAATVSSTIQITDAAKRWRQQIALLKQRQRAFGSLELLRAWVQARDWQMREIPLP